MKCLDCGIDVEMFHVLSTGVPHTPKLPHTIHVAKDAASVAQDSPDPTDPVPLSAAIDAAKDALREQFARNHGDDWSAADHDRHFRDEALLNQRLATLDEARATPVAPEGRNWKALDIEGDYPDPAPVPLSAALEAVGQIAGDDWEPDGHGGRGWVRLSAVEDRLEAALRSVSADSTESER